MADLEPSERDALTIDAREEDAGVIIRMAGDLDMASVDKARAVIDTALAGQPRRVILDASALAYTDSSGIALLVQVTRRAQQVQVRNPSPVVRQLIELTGLSQILDIIDENQP